MQNSILSSLLCSAIDGFIVSLLRSIGKLKHTIGMITYRYSCALDTIGMITYRYSCALDSIYISALESFYL